MSTTTQGRAALPALYVGLGLTLAATLAPFVDRAAGEVLAEHIRHGYPSYSASEVDAAVTTWLVVLATLGLLGMAGWVATIWAVRARRRWARRFAAALLAAGALVALTVAFTPDTSGEVGLAPLLGAIELLPVAAGAVAVVLLRRKR